MEKTVGDDTLSIEHRILQEQRFLAQEQVKLAEIRAGTTRWRWDRFGYFLVVVALFASVFALVLPCSLGGGCDFETFSEVGAVDAKDLLEIEKVAQRYTGATDAWKMQWIQEAARETTRARAIGVFCTTCGRRADEGPEPR